MTTTPLPPLLGVLAGLAGSVAVALAWTVAAADRPAPALRLEPPLELEADLSAGLSPAAEDEVAHGIPRPVVPHVVLLEEDRQPDLHRRCQVDGTGSLVQRLLGPRLESTVHTARWGWRLHCTAHSRGWMSQRSTSTRPVAFLRPLPVPVVQEGLAGGCTARVPGPPAWRTPERPGLQWQWRPAGAGEDAWIDATPDPLGAPPSSDPPAPSGDWECRAALTDVFTDVAPGPFSPALRLHTDPPSVARD